MFAYLRKRRETKEKARALYPLIVEQARQPVFYSEYGVPDSVDGRFEMIALHCFIIIRRFHEAGESKTGQALFDVFFKSMDRSLREMGVGDLGVPKHMKRMMQGFNGRANHYEQALKSGNTEELKQALIKNVYGTIELPDNNWVNALAEYVERSAKMQTTEAEFAALEDGEKRRA